MGFFSPKKHFLLLYQCLVSSAACLFARDHSLRNNLIIHHYICKQKTNYEPIIINDEFFHNLVHER